MRLEAWKAWTVKESALIDRASLDERRRRIPENVGAADLSSRNRAELSGVEQLTNLTYDISVTKEKVPKC